MFGPTRRPGRRDESTGRFLTKVELAEFHRIRRNLTIALGALFVVVMVGVVGYLIIGGGRYGVLDAIYMTVITLSTVGYTEVIDLSGNPTGRMFTVALLVGGMGIVAYSVTMVAALLVEGQLHRIFARRRMEKAIEKMRNHYIVCGDTSTCRHVVEELVMTNRECLAVVPSEEELDTLRNSFGDTPAFLGDPSDDDVLERARIDRAAGVVFCMMSDKDNLLGVFTARRLAPEARIVAAADAADTRSKLLAAGADAVVRPGHIGGLRMASELVRPTVVTFLDQMLRVGDGSLRVEEVAVPAGVEGEARTLSSVGAEEIPEALIVAVRPPDGDAFDFDPDPETPLREGMTLVVMADAAGRKRIEERLADLAGGT